MHIVQFFAIARNMCLKLQNYMEPYGREKVQIYFSMHTNRILVVNFSRNIDGETANMRISVAVFRILRS